MLDRKEKDGGRFVQESYDSRYVGGFANVQAHMNREEFYTYLAGGEFTPRVEEALKTDYQKAYKIFDRIRDNCKLKNPSRSSK